MFVFFCIVDLYSSFTCIMMNCLIIFQDFYCMEINNLLCFMKLENLRYKTKHFGVLIMITDSLCMTSTYNVYQFYHSLLWEKEKGIKNHVICQTDQLKRNKTSSQIAVCLCSFRGIHCTAIGRNLKALSLE